MNDGLSSTRLYLANLPLGVSEVDVLAHFSDSPGKITEVNLLQGFGFVEFTDSFDARDAVPAFHGSDLWGNRLTVQLATPRPKDAHSFVPRQRYGSEDTVSLCSRSTTHLLGICCRLPQYTSLPLKDHIQRSQKDNSIISKATSGGFGSTAEFLPPQSYPPPSYYSWQPDGYHLDHVSKLPSASEPPPRLYPNFSIREAEK